MYSTKALIKPSSIVVYTKYEGTRRPNTLPLLSARIKNVAGGKFSKLSQRRFRNAVENLAYTATFKTVFVQSSQSYFRYKLNFITLTLPSLQKHTDTDIVKFVLSPFLEAWAKRRKGFLYVWKAEKQDNGNIHFHITTNSFIHYNKLRDRWNKAINKLGYVDRCSTPNPNSTDVHSVSNINNLASYLVNYMGKKDLYKKPLKRWLKVYKKQHQDRSNSSCQLPRRYFEMLKDKVSCALWGSSKILSTKGVTVDYEDTNHSICWRILERTREYAINNDYVYIYPLETNALKALKSFSNALHNHFASLIKVQSLVPNNDVIKSL